MNRYPLIKVCILFISGIILQKFLQLNINFLFLSLFLAIVCGLILLFVRGVSPLVPSYFLLGAIVLTSGYSYQLAINQLRPYPFDLPKIKEIEITGIIKNIELKREGEIRLTLDLYSMSNLSHRFDCNLRFLCKIREERFESLDSIYNIVHPGNIISLKGIVSKAREKRNPWEFDYQKYLVERGYSGLFICSGINNIKIIDHRVSWYTDLIFNVRKDIDQRILLLHSKECAALLRGLLLADRSEINDEIQADFINTGIVHILAVSGSNVLLVILIFSFLFGRLQIYSRIFLTIIGLILFLIITGFTASVLRAVLMAVIVLIAQITNRSSNISNALFFSALIILIIDPLQLFDPGFQLSYSAVFSLIYINPQIISLIKNHSFYNIRIFRFLTVFSIVTFSAQLGTLPFVLYYFGKLSLISIVSNILIIPLITVLTASGMFSLAIYSFSEGIAKVYSDANNMVMQLSYSIAHYLSNLEYSFLYVREFSLLDSFFFYAILSVFLIFVKKCNGVKNKLILLSASVATFFSLVTLDNRALLPAGKLSIMAIDVGQGDATLVRFPNGQTMLIDAGETNLYFDNGEKVILPLLNRLGIDSINYGVISHLDNDHYSGFISLLKKGLLKKIYKPNLDSSFSKDLKLERFIKENNVQVNYFTKEIISVGKTRVYVMNNNKWDRYKRLSRNDKGGILKICYGNTSFLFIGDASWKAEQLMIEEYGRNLSSDLLKLGHHGSKNSSSFNFLKTVNPKYSLISAGVQNRFKHPSLQVLKILDSLKIKVQRTDLNGAAIFVSDGNKIDLVDWKEEY